MNRVSAVTAFVLLGLAPALGSACEYGASSASAAPPEQLASSPIPAATRAPDSPIVKAAVPKRTAKQVVDKSKEPAVEPKVVAGFTN